MKALIQRVNRATVVVDGQTVGEIDKGLLVLLGVERGDDDMAAGKIAAKLCNYRVFADSDNKMNLSVGDVKGSVLLVSQFTLAANTDKGLRPSFSRAAEPAEAERLYLLVAEKIREKNIDVATGQFAANMQVELVNDGPVTFLLHE